MAERKNKQDVTAKNPRAAGAPLILEGEGTTVTYSMSIEEKAFIAGKGGSSFVRLMLAEYRKNSASNFNKLVDN